METWRNMLIQRPEDIGPLVRRRRRVLGWPQSSLAARVGVGRQWIVELERGKKGAPFDLVVKTLDALGYVFRVSDDAAGRMLVSSQVPPRTKTPASRIDGTGSPNEALSHTPIEPLAVAGSGAAERSDHPDALAYRITNFTSEIAPSRGHIYEFEYRSIMRRMVAHIIMSEGPLFDDLVARRIARAHGLKRATRKLLDITRDVTDSRFPRSTEGARIILWPMDADPKLLAPFRRAALSVRDHPDIPLAELASLAIPILAEDPSVENAVVLMGRRMGLGRITANTRLRLQEAAELAQRSKPDQ